MGVDEEKAQVSIYRFFTQCLSECKTYNSFKNKIKGIGGVNYIKNKLDISTDIDDTKQITMTQEQQKKECKKMHWAMTIQCHLHFTVLSLVCILTGVLTPLCYLKYLPLPKILWPIGLALGVLALTALLCSAIMHIKKVQSCFIYKSNLQSGSQKGLLIFGGLLFGLLYGVVIAASVTTLTFSALHYLPIYLIPFVSVLGVLVVSAGITQGVRICKNIPKGEVDGCISSEGLKTWHTLGGVDRFENIKNNQSHPKVHKRTYGTL